MTQQIRSSNNGPKSFQVISCFALEALPTLRTIAEAQAVEMPHGGVYLPPEGVLELRCVAASMLKTLDVLATAPWDCSAACDVPDSALEHLESMPRLESDWLSRSTVHSMKELHYSLLAAAYRRSSPRMRRCSSLKEHLLQAPVARGIRQFLGFIGESGDFHGGVQTQPLLDAFRCLELTHELVADLDDFVELDAQSVPAGLLAKVHRDLESRDVLALQEEPLQVVRSAFDAVVDVVLRREIHPISFGA